MANMALIDDILALPAELRATQDTQAIADALPPVVTIRAREIGKGRVLGTIGLEAGNKLLDTIDTDADFRHVKQLVANGWLDVGDALTRAMIDQVCAPEDGAALKALAEISTPIDEMTVRRVCWSADGEWLV